MKKFFISALFLLLALPSFSQRKSIGTDVFGDLTYRQGSYQATLKKNIFDDLTFSDNNNNTIIFEKKYLEQENRQIFTRANAKEEFFWGLIGKCRSEKNYQAKYSVDIFGTTIITDNRGNKVERGTDIFGNPSMKKQSAGRSSSFKKSLNGSWEYRAGSDNATLRQDIRNKWTYTDSTGNKFEFATGTWNNMMRRFGNEEEIFWFLVDRFMAY